MNSVETMVRKMSNLKPFFTYFGGKYRLAPRYPKPKYDTIIEPFAGSAGYSLRYSEREVILNDLDPVISEIWRYLINVKEEEILELPSTIINIEDFPDLTKVQQNFIGYWLQTGRTTPKKVLRKLSKGNELRWGDRVKDRIVNQLQFIRHWQVTNLSYLEMENRVATWYVDPPYQTAGRGYKINQMDYGVCANFCKSRTGQVIVCEASGANWLPFSPFADIHSGVNKVAKEVIWVNED